MSVQTHVVIAGSQRWIGATQAQCSKQTATNATHHPEEEARLDNPWDGQNLLVDPRRGLVTSQIAKVYVKDEIAVVRHARTHLCDSHPELWAPCGATSAKWRKRGSFERDEEAFN